MKVFVAGGYHPFLLVRHHVASAPILLHLGFYPFRGRSRLAARRNSRQRQNIKAARLP